MHDEDQLVVDVLVEKKLVLRGVFFHDLLHLDAVLVKLSLFFGSLLFALCRLFFLFLLLFGAD